MINIMATNLEKPELPIQEPLHTQSELNNYEVTHDSLTGLLNRRGLEAELQTCIENRPGEFAVLVIDLDGMKETNDTLGHEAGNELLRSAAEVIQNTIRHNRIDDENDILAKEDPKDLSQGARDGGDEFKILLAGVTNNEDLQTVTARLQNNFTEAGVSASIGGKVHEAGETAEQLLKVADDRMYDNKQARRLEAHTEEQQEVARNIGQILLENGMNARSLAGLLEALEHQDKAA